jgi:hypothetical protein
MNKGNIIKKKVLNGFKNNSGFYTDKETGEVIEGHNALNYRKDWCDHRKLFFKDFLRRYSLPEFIVHEKKWITPTDFYYLHVLITNGAPLNGLIMVDIDCLKRLVNETKVNTLRAKLRKVGLIEKIDGIWYINPHYYGQGRGLKKSLFDKFKVL